MTGHPGMGASVERIRVSEFRVIISSAFPGVYPEREYLNRHIFPELRDLCRERSVRFSAVHPLFGTALPGSEDFSAGTFMPDELNRHHPFFVGIIGFPSLLANGFGAGERPAGGLDLAGHFPAIAEERRGRFQHEAIDWALQHLVPSDRAFFYFSDPPGAADTWGRDEELRQRMEALKERIRRSDARVRESFSDLSTLGTWVRKDLAEAIEQFFPGYDPASWLDRERSVHEAFARERRRAYEPNDEMIRRLDRHAAGDDAPLVVTGEPGSGKSALLAYWSEQYRAAHADALLIGHYVGANPSGGGHLPLLQRVMAEIRDRCGVAGEIPTTAVEIESAFPFWLGHIGDRRLVLVIDALDQLDEVSRDLEWLPRSFRPNVRLVVSVPEGEMMRELVARGWGSLAVRPLSLGERNAIVMRYVREAGGGFSDQQIERVSSDPDSANPLVLYVRLDAFNGSGSEVDRNATIDRYLEAHGLQDTLQRRLVALEEQYGRHLVERVCSLLWGVRGGLSRENLFDLLGREWKNAIPLLASMRNLLVHRNGRLAFFHEQMRNAVRVRYLGRKGSRRKVHLTIAGYFERMPVSLQKMDELPWQLQEAGEPDRLAACISDIPLFRAFHAHARQYELLGYWLAVGERCGMAGAYLEAVREWELQEENPLELAALKGELGEFLMMSGKLSAAEILFTDALRLRQEHQGREALETALSMNSLGALHLERNAIDRAGRLLHDALRICRKVAGREHRATVACLDNLMNLYHLKGNLAGAERLARKVLKLRRAILGEGNIGTMESYDNLGAILYKLGRYEQVEPYQQKSLELAEHFLGDHPVTARCLNNLGVLYTALQRNDDAIGYFRRALDIAEMTLGPDHHQTASYMNNLGVLLKAQYRLPEAETLYRRALDITIRMRGENHPTVADFLITSATLHRLKGEFGAAEENICRALAIRMALYGLDHAGTALAGCNLGSLFCETGRTDEAIAAYETFIPVAIAHLGEEDAEVVASLEAYRALRKEECVEEMV